MGGDTLFVFILIGVASAMFASGRVRLDVVALLVVLALALSGILTVREVLAGFGDPVVILVAGLLVVGETLSRTGIAYSIGEWMTRVGGDSEVRLLILLMLGAAVLGSVMSSTAVVAVFIPIVLNISARTNLNASRLLIPLSYGALISGMLTLIATTPNLVVSEELVGSGFEPLSFFSFTPIGIGVLVVGILYMVALGRGLLPGSRMSPPKSEARSMWDMLAEFDLDAKGRQLEVLPGSSLVGKNLGDLGLAHEFDFWVVCVNRTGRFGTTVHAAPGAGMTIRSGDVLLVRASDDAMASLVADAGARELPIDDRDRKRIAQEVGLASVLIHPESRLIGSSVRDSAVRSTYGVHVLAIRHKGEVLEDVLDHDLQAGDALLVLGPWNRIGALQSSSHDFVVLNVPQEIKQVAPSRRKAPLAVAILVGMVALSVFEIVPVVIAVLMAALATVLTRILPMEEAYRTIHWSSLVLIAGMLPIADAMVKTGGVDLIVDGMTAAVGGAGPYVMMTAIFFIAAVLGAFLSNTATAVLMAPIAIRAAEVMEVSPYAFAMTVAIAASAAYVTPVSSPVVTLVVDPGHYRFMDFVKVGTPMLVLTWVVAMLVIPLLFGF